MLSGTGTCGPTPLKLHPRLLTQKKSTDGLTAAPREARQSKQKSKTSSNTLSKRKESKQSTALKLAEEKKEAPNLLLTPKGTRLQPFATKQDRQ